MAFEIPPLDPRRLAELSPFTDEAEQSTREFVRRFRLAPDEAARHHHERSLLGTLMGRAYPHAGPVELCLVTDWISCMLVLDDQFDETELGRDPDLLRRACAEILGWLPVEGPGADAPPHEPVRFVPEVFRSAFSDLWNRLGLRTTPAWRARMTAHLSAFFDTCVWESENRRSGRVPGIDEYLRMRRSALMPYLDLIEVTTRWEVPLDLYRLPDLTELNAALSDADLWTNDLFSCEKEILLGDQHNLVLVHLNAHGGSLQESAREVARMTQERIDYFNELSGRFVARNLRDQADHALVQRMEAHLRGLASWLSGQNRWRHETRRFDPGRPEVQDASGTTAL
ncbi:hypothetical protein [Frankia sp. AgB32]|uniref:terpene synthase family protein n=1 Tax=Frankia sp. AgB32 TaxID=631119 RepID=UPI00200EEA57|nr:hypothetical protein [Frankia sp. AgB32]MCK9896357.1 hypothetical protein [Frankia sp. AgB32]